MKTEKVLTTALLIAFTGVATAFAADPPKPADPKPAAAAGKDAAAPKTAKKASKKKHHRHHHKKAAKPAEAKETKPAG